MHQNGDILLTKIMDDMERFTRLGYNWQEDSLLLYRNRICVAEVEAIRQEILTEAHRARYTIHPGVTKTYQTLR